jgi:hypothetical protein
MQANQNLEAREIVPASIWTIDNFFSPEECAHFIALSEGRGYEEALVTTSLGAMRRPEVRNNDRVIWDDPELAARLWQRLQASAPSPVDGDKVVGLNERWRFYRYNVGQTFAAHYDGAFIRPNGEHSQVTFMVYLNGGFRGGATRFDLRYPHGEMQIEPREGMALMFLHHLRHEGAPVESGRKYVLRTDIMYEKPHEQY